MPYGISVWRGFTLQFQNSCSTLQAHFLINPMRLQREPKAIMRTRKLTKFCTAIKRNDSIETVELEGFPLVRGLILSKLIKYDTDGDVRYQPTLAIYDLRTGSLLGSALTPTFLLHKNATPTQILNKIRIAYKGAKIAEKLTAIKDSEPATKFVLGNKPSLRKAPKPALQAGYALFDALTNEVKAAIALARLEGRIDAAGAASQCTFRITKTMFKVVNCVKNLTRFLDNITAKKRVFSDALLTAPKVVYTPAMQLEDERRDQERRESYLEASRNMTPKTPTATVETVKTCHVRKAKPKTRNSCEDDLKAIVRGDFVNKYLVNDYVRYCLIQKTGANYSLTPIGQELVDLTS